MEYTKIMSDTAKAVLTRVERPYIDMYYVGVRDGFNNVLNILKENKEKGVESLEIDDLSEAIEKLIRLHDGNITEDDLKLEDRSTAPKDFKEKGMSDEAFRALMNFQKSKSEPREEIPIEDNTEVVEEELGDIIDEEPDKDTPNIDPELLSILNDRTNIENVF